MDWMTVTNTQSPVDHKLEAFDANLNGAIMPLIEERTIKCNNDAKGFDAELHDLKVKKISTYQRALFTNNEIQFEQYKMIRNQYNLMVRQKKNEYMARQIEMNSNDQRKMWKCLKRIIKNDTHEVTEMQ